MNGSLSSIPALGSVRNREYLAILMPELQDRFARNALVIDLTNFSPKTDFQGLRENVHLVERWTRTSDYALALCRDPSSETLQTSKSALA